MKFYDQLCLSLPDEYYEEMKNDDVIVIDASNVAKAIDIDEFDHEGVDNPYDYGVISPPFEEFFIESTTFRNQKRVQRAIHFTAIRNPDTLTHREPTHLENLHHEVVMTTKRLAKVREYHHAYLMNAFSMYQNMIAISRSLMFVHLDDNGRFMRESSSVFGIPSEPERVSEIARKTNFSVMPHEISATLVPFALLALSAMHKRAPIRHATPSRKQQRRHMKKTKQERPLTEYYDIEIDPERTRLDYSNFTFVPVKNSRSDSRVHSVRGHFKFYDEKRPLFGRVTGAVWCPGHMRGNREKGKIVKGYKVKS